MQEPIDPGVERAVEVLMNAGIPEEQARAQISKVQVDQRKIAGDIEALRACKDGDTVQTHDKKYWIVRFVAGEPMLEPDTRSSRERRAANKPKRKRWR